MPIPKPKKDEKKEEFIKRCMSNSKMKQEYPTTKQRLAVCNDAWKRGKTK